MKLIKNSCSIITIVKSFVIRSVFLLLYFLKIFCFRATLLIATDHNSEVEIVQISNYSIAQLKNFNFRLK